MEQLIWYSPMGDTITFSLQGPYIWMSEDDFARTKSSALTTKGPFQVGVTLLDSEVDARTFSISIAIVGDTRQEYQENRSQLSRAMAIIPQKHGGNQMVGVLRYERDNLTPLELECVPIDSPSIDEQSRTAAYADIEFYAPHPFWRETADRFHEFQYDGGLGVPVGGLGVPEAGLAVSQVTVEVEVDNQGDVHTPPLFRIYGRIVDPVLRNLTTGDVLGLTGEIAEGDYVEIQTAFGKKSIVLVHPDGTREDAFGMLDLSQSAFWQIERGVNTIRLNYSENFTGLARMWWRYRYAGV